MIATWEFAVVLLAPSLHPMAPARCVALAPSRPFTMRHLALAAAAPLLPQASTIHIAHLGQPNAMPDINHRLPPTPQMTLDVLRSMRALIFRALCFLLVAQICRRLQTIQYTDGHAVRATRATCRLVTRAKAMRLCFQHVIALACQAG